MNQINNRFEIIFDDFRKKSDIIDWELLRNLPPKKPSTKVFPFPYGTTDVKPCGWHLKKDLGLKQIKI